MIIPSVLSGPKIKWGKLIGSAYCIDDQIKYIAVEATKMFWFNKTRGNTFPQICWTRKIIYTIKPILTILDKIFKELGPSGRSQSELELYTKTSPKTERVNKLEDDLLAKISELKVIFSKKYVEKSE